ncbi:pentapeptide repeat-containing protein [Sorangium sp. So ce1078]|uniref:pentapeptide repeat-containing protein n=1 Tax=Sorangium sp. So ce1078 TaxID=3133329 RepID=UPI003F603060
MLQIGRDGHRRRHRLTGAAGRRNASFVGADLRYARSCGASIDETANFTGADLGGAIFTCP